LPDVRQHSYLSAAVALSMLCASVGLAGCGGQPAAPSRPPDPALPVPVDSEGPVRITFVAATIAPGSTITGSAPLIERCAGRLRMTFSLTPPSDGPVLYARLYLHATNLQACLWGEIASFTVRARVPVTIEMPLDRADRCGTPTDIATMALVVEGTMEVASRQTWTLRYLFAP
jgi:hypothetical protein